MQTRYWPFMAGLVLCLTAALGCVTYMFSGGDSPLFAFALCALSLMVGQLLLGIYSSLQASLSETNDRQLAQKIGTVGISQETVQRQAEFALTELSNLKTLEVERGIAMTQSLDELKTSYEALAKSMQGDAVGGDDTHLETHGELAFADQGRPSEPMPEPGYGADGNPVNLDLSLEPIVDLVSGRTAHYRVHFAPAGSGGEATGFRNNLAPGDQPQIDICAVRESLDLVQHLHQRDPQIKLFLTLSAESLGSPAIMLHILEILQASPEPEAATSLVFELAHATLAGLSATALEGLGYLARAGQPLALTNVSISGLEPSALQALNMRHVSLDANAIDLRFGMPASYQHFVQLARIANVQVMLANVNDAASLPQLRRLSRLGSGPVFATPRRVRRNLAPTQVELAA